MPPSHPTPPLDRTQASPAADSVADAWAARIRRSLPAAPALGLALAEPEDRSTELLDEERSAIAHASDKRVHDYSTGRALARRAMQTIGLPPRAVPQGPGRAPEWPADCVGSITHAHGLAAAAVARRGDASGLGIDLELADRVTPRLHARLFTVAELARSGDAPAMSAGEATLRFSAKEAVYKAVNPLVGRFIGFHEVEVLLDADRRANAWPAGDGAFEAGDRHGRFGMRYVGEHVANRVMERGAGWYWCFGGYVFTLFLIP